MNGNAASHGRGTIVLLCGAALAAAALALPAWLGGSGPAAAAPASKHAGSKCPKGYLCLWEDPDYQGLKLRIKGRALSNDIYDHGFNDSISSVKLHKKGSAMLFEDYGGEGSVRCLTGDLNKIPDLADPGWNFDDTASSSRSPKAEFPNNCPV
jgi:Peptidase inhibitor family I36